MAELVAASPCHLSNIELGNRSPSPALARCILHALGVMPTQKQLFRFFPLLEKRATL